MVQRFDVSILQHDYLEFEKTKEMLKQNILSNFLYRKQPCVLVVNGKEFDMLAGKVFLNFMLLSFFVQCGIEIIESDIYQEDYVSEKSLDKYMSYVLTRYSGTNEESYEAFRTAIIDVLNKLADVAAPCNVLVGNTISLNDFIILISKNPEARQLFRPDIPYGMQFNEIEQLFNECGKKLMDLFIKDKERELHPYCISGTGINVKQFTQMASFVGLKPDMKGGVIPVVIKDNFLYGLSNLQNYYINCVGTRKASYTNYTYVRKSGYLTRKLLLAMSDVRVNPGIVDCGTKHYYYCNVHSKDRLKQIIGRHYYDINEDGSLGKELKTITLMSPVVGKTIALRSPITCQAHDDKGDCICATCYGKRLAHINSKKHAGEIATFTLTDPLTQKLLSAKHLLSTNTEVIDFGDDFTDAFTINLNTVYFNENSDYNIEFAVPSNDDFDEDTELYYVTKIKLINNESKKVIEYNSPVELYINPKISFLTEDEENVIVTSKLNDWIFQFTVKNNELTKSLENILNLIESANHLGISEYSEFANKFADLLIENGLDKISSVHPELIASILIRDVDTNKRLDFSKENIDPYKIIRVSKAVMSGPISKSIAFERLKEQFSNLDTYDKDEESYIDNLFR